MAEAGAEEQKKLPKLTRVTMGQTNLAKKEGEQPAKEKGWATSGGLEAPVKPTPR